MLQHLFERFNMNNHPLVSVVIVTYNSAAFVLDALESVKEQTYDNIELIVSDDCSKDDTVSICEQWIETNKDRFVNVVLVTTEKNTGTAANCNRGLSKCKGEWLKLFAGDDALCSNCIEDFVGFVTENPEAKLIIGVFEEYEGSFVEGNKVDYHSDCNTRYLDDTAEKQFEVMVQGSFILPCACFLNMEMVRSVGGYDEKYGVFEDLPFYLKVLKSGYRCFRMDKVVAKYRLSDSNIWANSSVYFNYDLKKKQYLVLKDWRFPYYSRGRRIICTCHHYFFELLHFLHLDKNTPFNNFLWKNLNRIAKKLQKIVLKRHTSRS